VDRVLEVAARGEPRGDPRQHAARWSDARARPCSMRSISSMVQGQSRTMRLPA
jgi:hypothetical protein